MPQSTYLPPRRRCEAAVALPATLKPGCRSRFTCCLDLEITEGRSGPTCCLVMNARRLSSYLLLCCLNAAVVLLAALPWMRGGDRLACDLVDRRAKWSYLLPRHRCEAVLADRKFSIREVAISYPFSADFVARCILSFAYYRSINVSLDITLF